MGTITKVEIRTYGYGSNGAAFINFTPVFVGGDGDIQVTNNWVSPGWSAYYDITNDTNAEDWAGWNDIQNLDIDVKGNGNGTVYCSKVEIRVTYIPS